MKIISIGGAITQRRSWRRRVVRLGGKPIRQYGRKIYGVSLTRQQRKSLRLTSSVRISRVEIIERPLLAVSRACIQANSIKLIDHCWSKQTSDCFLRKEKGLQMKAFSESGSPTRTRTRDQLINSQSLYQLSYRGSVRPEFSSSTRPKSSRQRLFYAPHDLLEGLQRAGERESQVTGRPKGTAGNNSEVRFVQEV